jgi:hypothetical protein
VSSNFQVRNIPIHGFQKEFKSLTKVSLQRRYKTKTASIDEELKHVIISKRANLRKGTQDLLCKHGPVWSSKQARRQDDKTTRRQSNPSSKQIGTSRITLCRAYSQHQQLPREHKQLIIHTEICYRLPYRIKSKNCPPAASLSSF